MTHRTTIRISIRVDSTESGPTVSAPRTLVLDSSWSPEDIARFVRDHLCAATCAALKAAVVVEPEEPAVEVGEYEATDPPPNGVHLNGSAPSPETA